MKLFFILLDNITSVTYNKHSRGCSKVKCHGIETSMKGNLSTDRNILSFDCHVCDSTYCNGGNALIPYCYCKLYACRGLIILTFMIVIFLLNTT